MDKKYKNEKGVALLFAIGVLALLMFLALAFVTNAMLGQKTASNVNNRTLATLLARSASSRIMASLASYSLQCKPNQPNDFSFLHSFDNSVTWQDGENSTASAKIDDLIVTKTKIKKDDDTEEQVALTDSIMDIYANTTRYYGRDSQASWLFYKDTAGKLIGRVAFWVLPPDSPSKMDLKNTLEGFYTEDQKHMGAKPYNYRVGHSTDEIHLGFEDNSYYTPLSWWGGSAPPTKGDDEYKRNDFLNAYGAQHFNTETNDGSTRRRWLMRWFAEPSEEIELKADGKTQATINHNMEMEAYSYYARYRDTNNSFDEGDTIFFHRFNLAQHKVTHNGTDYDYWNNVVSVNKLLMLADDTDSGDKIDVAKRLLYTPVLPENFDIRDIGLMFLRKIGSTKGTFDSIASLRKQITANLIDYCDANSKPTSDVDSDSWSVDDSSQQPKYTGNEKTAYINEIAVGAKLEVTEGLTTGSVILKATPELIAELINIYEEDNKSYQLSTKMEMKFSAVVKSKWEVTYDDAGTTQTVLTDTLSQGIELTYPETAVTCSTAPSAPPFTGYTLLGNTLVVPEVSGTVNFTFVQPGVTTAKLKEISVQITSAQAKFKGFVLRDTTNNINVDFVSPGLLFGAVGGKYLFNASANSDALVAFDTITDGSDIKEKYNRFYLVGLEVNDPRQNLNVRDWRDPSDPADPGTPKLLGHDAKTGTVAASEWTSFELDTSKTTLAERLKAGLRNTDSNPAKKMDGSDRDSSLCDKESVEDPAWKSDTEHLSTAYIRNHRMCSPWELGAIHRGIAWQTINLKSAKSILHSSQSITPADHVPRWSITDERGTSYMGGDAGILNEIKMTDAHWTFGKIDVNMFNKKFPRYMNEDNLMAGALFRNLRYGQKYDNIGYRRADVGTGANAEENVAGEVHGRRIDAYKTGTLIEKGDEKNIANALVNKNDSDREFSSRAEYIDWCNTNVSTGLNSSGLYNLFGQITPTPQTDAAQEEIVGKTVNLLKTVATPPEVTQVLVVAQTIRDIGTPTETNSSGEFLSVATTGTPVIKLTSNNTAITQNCREGVWDCYTVGQSERTSKSRAEYLNFDEITGEVKMLITMQWDPTNNKMKLLQIEYID